MAEGSPTPGAGADGPTAGMGRDGPTPGAGADGSAVGPAVDAVVFDLGGVLIDWDPRHLYRKLFEDAAEMEEFLARVCTRQWHLEHDLGADVAQSCRRLAGEHPDQAELIMAWAERGEEMARGQFDPVVGVLAEVKAAGVRCYALSNMEREAFLRRKERFGFMAWFDGQVISGVEGVAKPDQRIFEILLRRYGLVPQATVFVDDMPANVEAARALGIRAVLHTSAGQLRAELRRLGVALTAAGAPPSYPGRGGGPPSLSAHGRDAAT